jgi:hypothetical protein
MRSPVTFPVTHHSWLRPGTGEAIRRAVTVAQAGLLLAAAAGAAFGQSAPDPLSSAAHVDAVRVAAKQLRGRIQIDGRLSEGQWLALSPVASFTQQAPRAGQPGSERTEVKLLIDDRALYVGVRLNDTQAATLISQAIGAEAKSLDVFEVALDPAHGHSTAFVFGVSPDGSIRDARIRADGTREDSWNAEWQAQTRWDRLGWSAEIRIPLTVLRGAAGGQWGIQLTRFIARKQESTVFAYSPDIAGVDVTRFAHLDGVAFVRVAEPVTSY